MEHPFVAGFVIGVLSLSNAIIFWRDIVMPIIFERRARKWEEWKWNYKWPEPPPRTRPANMSRPTQYPIPPEPSGRK